MSFTVRDMLDLEVLNNIDVVAGYEGLNNKVENITFLDAPDAVKWLRGSEFIITTLYLFRDTSEQLKLIELLAAKNVSALGIKLNRFVYKLAPEVVALADKLSMPLLSIPVEIAWVDLINPVMAELLNRQLVIFEKANSIRRLFIQEVLEGRRLESFARLLFRLTNKPITIMELINKNTVTWPYYFEHHFDRESIAGLQIVRYKNQETVKSTLNDTEGLVVPIEVGKKVEGFIIVWQTKELQDLDLVAVEQATTVTALYIQQLKAVNEINQRYKDDFISCLLRGEFTSSYVREKAREMDWAIAEKNRIVVARIGSADINESWGKSYHIFNHYRGVLEGYTPFKLLMGMDKIGTIIFVLPWQSEKPIHNELVELICATREKFIQQESALKLGLGISSLGTSIDSIPNLYKEASTACKVSMALNKACFYEELGSYSLLVELLNFPETEQYLDKLVTPVLSYDRDNKTELLKTLETFLNYNCNYRETAKAMYVHHNTIRYRMEMIEKLLNVDLKKPEAALNLMLAIKLFNLKYSNYKTAFQL